MRIRLLSVALGAALALTAAPLLADPALADAPPPTPVEIGPLTDGVAYSTLDDFSDTVLGISSPAAQRVQATGTGPLESLTMWPLRAPADNYLTVYADDQFALTDTPGLSPIADSVFYAGEPLATATLPATTAGDDPVTGPFDQPATITAGHWYWLVYSGGYPGSTYHPGVDTGFYYGNGTSYAFTMIVSLNLDAPPIGVELSGSAGTDGWYRSAVTATYSCRDTVATCPSPQTFGTDGEYEPSGVVDDGDEFAWFHRVKVDTTAPAVSGSASRSGTGFQVTWTCTDATSGVAQCPDPTYVSGIGSDTVATGVATDNAGNTRTATVAGLSAAKQAPLVTITGVVPGKTYKHGTKLKPTCTATSTLTTLRKHVTAHTVPCTGTTTKKKNKNGSVTWTYTATAVDPHPAGGTTTTSVSWKVAAKPKATLLIDGLPGRKKNGVAVIDHRKSYDLSFVFRTASGKKLTGKPTWLHSVKTNKSGSKGKPTTKAEQQFTKVRGVWTKTFTPGYHYAGEYRKFGVVAPNGKRHYVVVYVK